ncbi:MAG: Do family serine endopeptidase [Xanthomonadales bacterium]|nr:Do family serine endopeptidase [Xanthomonadales bacterium]
MRIWMLSLFLISLLFSLDARPALPASVDGQPLPSLAPILEDVTPSVVNIYTQTRVRVRSPLLDDPIFRRFFNVPDIPRERVSQSLGSGVIVDAARGYVLTNNHVIEGADDIAVTLKDGRSLDAELIGTDPDTDLAVIRIEPVNLRALRLADSDQLKVGDFVVAVGNPFGLGQTVTSGIVSALGRTGVRGLEFQNFIQTDASINPGNSGGALINLRGELVGINSAIFTPSGGNVGIGFAIPSSMARYVMDQLIRFGEVRRGTLGLVVQDLTRELATAFGIDRERGALVAEVMRDTAADQAGLQAGDVITAVAGRPINNARDFLNAEGSAPIGEALEVEVVRDKTVRRFQLQVREPLRLEGAELGRRFAGAIFTELPARLRSNRLTGVLLAELDSRSLLAYEGLRPGDVITGVNRDTIRNLAELRSRLRGLRGPFVLQINRNGDSYFARID